MFKVIFRVISERRDLEGLASIKRAGFIPYMSKRNNNEEIYATVYRSNDPEEVREAITEAAFFLQKVGRKGSNNFATLFKVNDSYLGKGIGGVLGASLGLKVLGVPGLILGAIGGLLLGEVLDIELNETYAGVYSWPMSIEQ
ncbi:hypothetical protein [Metallosphaera hakonensis]|uniref:Uncharacterized protein n=1 Tax=Metallosphaera hakonensis JCM 8857 = DSM 7519 TaxID=1293036 RepID=A0A2U9IUJ3_9CREN|nr:hypothetical protein [Metallosphaera hakonensis]AWR99706.1 hypothetical protein DFR87_08405 [Metallosphaera hakonensis JCM 8857 = DSM 7519]